MMMDVSKLEEQARAFGPWRYDHWVGDHLVIQGNPVTAPIHGDYGHGADTMRQIMARLASTMDIGAARALDLGCLEGHYTDILCAAGFKEVVAVDLSPQHLARVRFLLNDLRGYNNATIVNGDVEDPALLASLGHFDVILFHGLLYHLTDPASFLARLRTIGTPAHKLLLSTQFKFAYADIISDAPLASIKFRKVPVNDRGNVVYEDIGSTYASHAVRLNPRAVHSLLLHVGYKGIVGYHTILGARYGYQLHVVATPEAEGRLTETLSKHNSVPGLAFYPFDGMCIDGVDFRRHWVPRLVRFLSRINYFIAERLGTSGQRERSRAGIPNRH